MVSLIFAFLQFNKFNDDNPAIVFAEESSVKSEPNAIGQEAFTLHEGTKVNVIDELNDWKKIKIADGTIGWIREADIKILKDF